MRAVTAKERLGRELSRGNLLLEKSGGGEGQPVGAVVLYDDDQPAVCSNFVARMELAQGMVPSFWRYVHAAAYAVRLTTRSINQTSGIQNLDQSQYFDELVPFPPEGEQTAIATFLDQETGKINALVEEQKRLIRLLKEKRQAVISHAVTKGLDPSVRMKSSGLEWLGEVPEHWEVRRLATLFRAVAEAGSADLPIFSVSIHHGVSDTELDEDELERKVARSDDRSKYKRVERGDLVYNMMRAWQGAFGAVQTVGMVSPAYVVARPTEAFATRFVEAMLRTPTAIEEMRRRSRGVTDFRLRLYWEEFKDLTVALPPPDEQRAIMDFVAAEDTRIGDLVDESRRLVDLLQERRTALISAAVTGKIDVRNITLAHGRAA